jgi:hypothetical protein
MVRTDRKMLGTDRKMLGMVISDRKMAAVAGPLPYSLRSCAGGAGLSQR